MRREIRNRRRSFPVLAVALAVIAVTACGSCRRGATHGEIQLADALERLALGDSAGARQSLEAARYDLPRDPRVLFHYGRLLAAAREPVTRAQAERALRAAVEQVPDAAAYREELGVLLLAQGFHNDGKAELVRAVELDPTRARAWRALGHARLRDWRDDPDAGDLRDASAACFRAVLVQDGADEESRYALACLLLFAAGAVDDARDVMAPVLAASGCNARAMLLQVAIEVRARRFTPACDALDRAVGCLLPDERAAWIGADGLIPPDSAGAWALWTSSQRDSFSQAFWFALDPTPATLANERIAEHVTRRCEASFRFVPHRADKDGCATDRGDIFVRWGPPASAINRTPGQARVWYWSYAGGPGPQFVFIDRYLNGDYVLVRRHARSDYMHPQPLEVHAQLTGLNMGPAARAFQARAARFRGSAGRTAVEWTFETAEDSSAVEVRAAAWNGPRRLHGRVHVPRLAVERNGGRIIGRTRFEATSPAEEVALEVEASSETGGKRWRHAARTPLAIGAVDLDTLQMSDLLPAYALAEGDVADPRRAVRTPRADSLVTGGDLHVYFEIYPSRTAVRETRILEVAYRIETRPKPWRFRDQFGAAARARDGDRAVVESTFELRARRDREGQRLTVDVRGLRDGPHVFVVTVRDPRTGTVVARHWPFAVAAGGAAGGN